MKFICLFVLISFPFNLLAQMDERFQTRLTSRLAIAGHFCSGDEVTVGKDFGTYMDVRCTNQEWMIYVDNINRCSQGKCTEIEVLPFTAKLKFKKHVISDQYRFYAIIPTMPVGPEVRWILRNHHLRADMSGSILVLRHK
jgi:hypothetical protein